MRQPSARFPLGPNWPFAPARVPVFYGWLILVLATLGALASIPGQTAGVSVFTDPLLEATGVSRIALANTYLVGTLASGLLLPRGGRLLDRYGPRATAMTSAVALGVTLAGMSQIDRIARAVGSSALVMIATLMVGFALLRFSGQGMLTLAGRVMVVKWFSRRRGFASGLFSVSVSLGFSLAPAVLAVWIGFAGGWREAWQSLALVVGVGMTLVAWLFYRNDPEECGLHMDGDAEPPRDEADGTDRHGSSRQLTLDEALRSGAFWAVALGLAIESCVVTGITFHIVDLGAEAGLTRDQAVRIFPPIAVTGMVVGFLSGAAADRVRLRPLVLLMLAGQAIGFVGFARFAEPAWVVAAIGGIGLGSGLFGSLSTLAMAKLFGRPHVGAITSAQMSAMVIGSALGPSILALSRDTLGSYVPALYAAAALPVLVGLLALTAKDPSPAGRVW